ncbi:MAG: hypothetical protein QM817_06555 [Archangium sp.]
MRPVVVLSAVLLLASLPVRAEEVAKQERVERAVASKSWRVPRVIVLPLVGAATTVATFYAFAIPLNLACSGQFGGDYIGPCTMGMMAGLALAYTVLTPLTVTLVGALMKGRGNFFMALAGSASAMLLAVVSAFVALPVSFLFPMFTGMVLAPIGSVIGYEISAAREETRALDEGPVVMPLLTPIQGGAVLGLSITNW